MNVVWLKGDYVGRRKERQRQARQSGCQFVLSFHCNSATPSARGVEAYTNTKCSFVHHKLANHLVTELAANMGSLARGVYEARGRSAFLNAYDMPAILLEIGFVSNYEDAKALHNIDIVRRLGLAIAKLTVQYLPDVKTVGLDIGHLFKSSAAKDMGAKCIYQPLCWEAVHAEQIAKVVAWHFAHPDSIDSTGE